MATDQSTFKFSSTVPAHYQALMVPRLFLPWAEKLVDRIGLVAGENVLDVATGPGTVARVAAARVGAKGRVVAADISPGMIEVAKTRPPVPDGASVEYLVAPAAPTGLASAAFDVVTCQQGLQFFPDRHAGLVEMQRVLRPGGRVAISVWCELERCMPFAAIEAALREATSPGVADIMKIPFSFPSAALLQEALEKAGFSEVKVEVVSAQLGFEKGAQQAAGLLIATPIASAVSELPEPVRDRLQEAAIRHLGRLLDAATGEVRGTMVANVATARKPS